MDLHQYWKETKESLQEEITISKSIWKSILTDYKVEVAYFKGSAIKNWKNPIDYVPLVSDLDIHYKLDEDTKKFSIEEAFEISKLYEQNFHKAVKDPIHLPRVQLLDIREFYKDPEVVLPLEKEVEIIIGDPIFDQDIDKSKIKKIDRNRLITNTKEIMDKLPGWILERNGLDLWILLRRICWRMSPIAARIISTDHENPLEVWSWNRTLQIKNLEEIGFARIANHLRNYYRRCWDLFLNNFSSIDLYHQVFREVTSINTLILENFQ